MAMPASIKLVGPAWSRAFRCLWMLEEVGIPYENLHSVMPVSRGARKLNVSGKVPILLEYDDDNVDEPSFVLSESVAINNYLADRYAPHLIPSAGTRERALYDQTVSCILSELDAQGLWLHRKHEGLGQHFGFIPNAVDHAQQQFERMNKVVAQSLRDDDRSSPPRFRLYLMGDLFTPADILYVHCLDWASSIGWKDDDDWAELGLNDYRKRCHERPAYQRAKALRDVGKEERKQKDKDGELLKDLTDSNKQEASKL